MPDVRAMSQLQDVPMTTSPDITIRRADARDAESIARLAALDSTRPPSGVVVLAERGTSCGPRSRPTTATSPPTRSARAPRPRPGCATTSPPSPRRGAARPCAAGCGRSSAPSSTTLARSASHNLTVI